MRSKFDIYVFIIIFILNLFQVNPSGPLRDLKNLLFGGGLVNTLKEFLTKHWYVGIAAGVGLIIIMVSLKRQLQLHIYYYGKSKNTITITYLLLW